MKKSFLKWFTDQLPIKYIAGIIKDAHYWQKHSLVDFLETQPKEKKYFTHLKRISLLIATYSEAYPFTFRQLIRV